MSFGRWIALSLLLPTSLLAQTTRRGPPATIHVPLDVPTIQGGIDRAQPGGAVLVQPGTYAERIDFRGKALVVYSAGGASVTTIDAGGAGTTVSFLSGEGLDSVLRGFTVTGGASLEGGGILCAPGARPRIDSCVVRGNNAAKGGGLAGDALVRACVIEDNAASSGGGVAGTAELRQCTIQRNSGDVGGGVWSPPGTQPRIVGSTFRSNSALGGYGIGSAVSGDPVLEDCVIEDNFGSAVYGKPVIRRCILQRNSAYDAAALYMLGGRVEDSAIVDNLAGEGGNGGAILIEGPDIVFLRCVVARNRQNTYGAYPTYGAAVQYRHRGGTPARFEHCTITDNVVEVPCVYGNDVGGVLGPVVLVNSILHGNDLADYLQVSATYSDVEGGMAGTGNFDADPIFVDRASGDYHLTPISPCIDAGPPGALEDDCTRIDVGAFWFPQFAALVSSRNGTGVNPAILSSLKAPRIGTSWSARVLSSSVPGATMATLVGHVSALDPGMWTPYGELLVTGSQFFSVSSPTSGGADDFTFVIPNDPALFCRAIHVQGIVTTSTSQQLTNALAVTTGR